MTTKKIKKPRPLTIIKEANALKRLKPRVRHFSGFGDDHHAAIDAQVEVLEQDLPMDMIDQRRGYEWTDSVTDAAIDARYWMDGEYEDYPRLITGWQELVL